MNNFSDYFWLIIIGVIPIIVMLFMIHSSISNWLTNRKSKVNIEEEAYERGWNAAIKTMKHIDKVVKEKKEQGS